MLKMGYWVCVGRRGGDVLKKKKRILGRIVLKRNVFRKSLNHAVALRRW